MFCAFNTTFLILNENEILNRIQKPIHNDCAAREISVENDINTDPIKDDSICEFVDGIFFDAFARPIKSITSHMMCAPREIWNTLLDLLDKFKADFKCKNGSIQDSRENDEELTC